MPGKDSQEEAIKQRIFESVRDYYRLAHGKEAFSPGASRVPYGGRVYDEKEIINLVDSALEFWLTAGRYAGELEHLIQQFLGVKHAVLTNSGSSANLLAVAALTSPKLKDRQLKPGDEVITVACAFPTTVAPIVQNGLVPVFVDVTLPTYNIDCSMLEEARSDKTKAVMVAHTLGNPFDVEKVRAFCDKHGLWLVEDNCDALGSRYKGKFTGGFGDIGTLSFYPAHHITMGEGGALLTNSTRLKRLIASYRDWGRDCWCPPGKDNTCGKRFEMQLGELPRGFDHKYTFSHFGYNLKVTDMQAAVGCAQMEKLPVFIEARKKNFDRLHAGLKPFEDRVVLPEATEGSEPCWFGFPMTVKDGVKKDDVVAYLESRKIQTRTLFAGNIIRHPVFDEMRKTGEGFRVCGSLENTDRIMRDTFWVGVAPVLNEEMIDYIVDTLKEYFGGKGK